MDEGTNLCHLHRLVFSVTYTIRKYPNLDAYISQSIMFVNCQNDTIHQYK